METAPIDPEEKLKLLQRLDGFLPWGSIHERRLCLGCGKIISGMEIKLSRSMPGLGLLSLRCPTENCTAGPMEWVDPDARK
ncbi:MAG TPA: hypothetical protein VH188_12685 [Chthoniobacterales bacterium]|nr:hypothetical protein [Chthoniobacterales bacterium]